MKRMYQTKTRQHKQATTALEIIPVHQIKNLMWKIKVIFKILFIKKKKEEHLTIEDPATFSIREGNYGRYTKKG